LCHIGEANRWARAHFLFARCIRTFARMALQLDRVREIVERVAQSHGLELWDLEFKGGGKARTLRIFIDKPEGVTHGDCENVSREVGTILDVEDAVPGGHYTLEVSSPGLDRKLIRPQHYERFAGNLVKLTTREPIGGSRHFEGRLNSVASGTLTLELGAGKSQAPGKVEIALANVEKANLVPEFK
jgi:ribosome maturation factor RimP